MITWKRTSSVTGLVWLPRRISSRSFTKLLHLRRRADSLADMNFLRWTLNSSVSSHPLKCLLKQLFFKNLSTKSCKSSKFLLQTYGFNYRFFGLLFKTNISRTAIFKQTSVITCNWITQNFYRIDFTYYMYLTFIVSFCKYQSEKWLVSSSYGLTIKLFENEKLQKYRIILSQHIN